ncbi:hypothetical protein UlMin_002799 [Ulmus minor]
MSETDVKALKETLQAQQQLLQKLYVDLDQEREASATAASEALSMILRLQGEKAAVKMEASQYKRLAEEKMFHAEESLLIFEDLIYQKEMEIASLEFQVQAYRCKLVSLGYGELGASENRFPENMFLQGSDFYKGEICVGGNIRRLSSLPPNLLKDSHHKKSTIEKERAINSLPDLVHKKLDQKADQECSFQSSDIEKKPSGNFSYWQQIRMLDEQVKELSSCKDLGRDKSTNLKSDWMSCSSSSEASFDQVKHGGFLQEREEIVSPPCSSSVYDVFEVPQVHENLKTREHQRKEQRKVTAGVEDGLGKPDLFSWENDQLRVKGEIDSVKKMLLCASHENRLAKPIEGTSSTCNLALTRPLIDDTETQVKFQQLSRRIERLEGERSEIREEVTNDGEEERNLLREIHEKLNVIEAEIRSWSTPKTKKTPTQDEEPLLSLMEAMLHFWL